MRPAPGRRPRGGVPSFLSGSLIGELFWPFQDRTAGSIRLGRSKSPSDKETIRVEAAAKNQALEEAAAEEVTRQLWPSGSGAGPSGTSGPSAPVASPKPRRSPRKRHFTPSPDCGLSPLSWLRDGLRSRDAMCVEALAERDMCTSRKRALTK